MKRDDKVRQCRSSDFCSFMKLIQMNWLIDVFLVICSSAFEY